MYAGEFELHLTGSEWQVDELAEFAREHQVKFTHIELHGGNTPSQPMLTVGAEGTIDEVRAAAEQWRQRLVEADLFVVRVKIEAAPWNEGVPQTDDEADPALYFEHHVKLRLVGEWRDWYFALYEALKPHEAKASRNARRTSEDGTEERFITQRCFGVGRATAKQRLEALLHDLKAYEVLEVEEEYVVEDDALHIDDGWIHGQMNWSTSERLRQAPAGIKGFPATYQPLKLTPKHDIRQRAVFDPAMKHHQHAFRGGDPKFGNPADGARWLQRRRETMAQTLNAIGGTKWAEHLVLRGSTVMREWFGDAAREPGDLDFVVTPKDIAFQSRQAEELVQGLRELVGPSEVEPIWTYERVPGLRIVFPFEVEGLPDGAIQIDLVFNEDLPIAPRPLEIAGTTLLAAGQELSLAWKLQWLVTDAYPQAKDLYDAALLAGVTTVNTGVVIGLLEPELGDRALDFDRRSVLEIDHVEWDNAPSEVPVTKSDESRLLERIAASLA
ncbi:nucleotidyl transferase AbiEii/AbiGii toxin family protein [Lentzea sp. NPDC058450]|uniref:nucleotidyl transferase AbiEii/AbiGii toxin family protein n=1 Tax=Lentzea sp. NPDC058450 TaxID=3346505 RepID=UPI003651ED73